MPKLARIAAAAVALTCALAFSGCDANDPEPSPEPTATDEPVFASEEEALAAATEAYAAYLAVADEVGSDGGADVNRLAQHASETYLAEQEKQYRNLEESGLRTSGTTFYQAPRLQSVEEQGGRARVSFYVCVDVTEVEILDAEGKIRTPPERIDLYPLVVVMSGDDSALLIESSESWSGANFCVA